MKILIISHNPITTYHNMGKTLKTLFQEFKKEELCQLYCYPTIPDIDYCNSYYRITDKDILKGYRPFSTQKGRIILNNEIKSDNKLFENEEDRHQYNATQDYKRILRDCMWHKSKWYSKRLRDWLDMEAPTCIFLAPGDAKFIYDIATKLSKEYSIPIITYLCDDYYFLDNLKGIWRKLRFKLLKKKISIYMKHVSKVVFICDKLKNDYSREFNIEPITIMTGTDYEIEKTVKINNAPQSISYFGNIKCNRHFSLIDIGNALNEINDTNDSNYSLKVYTNETNTALLRELETIKSVELCEFIKGEKFEHAMRSSDFLLHVEGFDKESIDLVKNSISTKIADSLGSGIPLIAYSPRGIASTEYLLQNDCANVISTRELLKEQLKDIFLNVEENKRIAERGLLVANQNHNGYNNSLLLKRYIEESV